MRDITRLVRRFVGILLLSTVLLIALNIAIIVIVSASNGEWQTVDDGKRNCCCITENRDRVSSAE